MPTDLNELVENILEKHQDTNLGSDAGRKVIAIDVVNSMLSELGFHDDFKYSDAYKLDNPNDCIDFDTFYNEPEHQLGNDSVCNNFWVGRELPEPSTLATDNDETSEFPKMFK